MAHYAFLDAEGDSVGGLHTCWMMSQGCVVPAPAIISGIAGVTHKNDSGFGDMMSRIAAANPTSPLAEKYGDKGVKATKTRQAVTRQKERQSIK